MATILEAREALDKASSIIKELIMADKLVTDEHGWSTKEQALQAEPKLASRIELYKGLMV